MSKKSTKKKTKIDEYFEMPINRDSFKRLVKDKHMAPSLLLFGAMAGMYIFFWELNTLFLYGSLVLFVLWLIVAYAKGSIIESYDIAEENRQAYISRIREAKDREDNVLDHFSPWQRKFLIFFFFALPVAVVLKEVSEDNYDLKLFIGASVWVIGFFIILITNKFKTK